MELRHSKNKKHLPQKGLVSQKQQGKYESERLQDEQQLSLYICDADEHMLSPLERIKYSLNEVQTTYGPVVKIKDAP